MRHRPRCNPKFDAAAEDRIERAVAYFEERARDALPELEDPESRRYEKYFDWFLEYLADNDTEIANEARGFLRRSASQLSNVDEASLLEAVQDPSVYWFGLSDRDGGRDSLVWRSGVNAQEIDANTRILEEMTDAGFSLSELAETARRLWKKNIKFWFSDSKEISSAFLINAYSAPQSLPPDALELLRRCQESWPQLLLDGVTIQTKLGVGLDMQARFDKTALESKLRELIDERERERGSAPDEVVYRYAGTNDTVAGASARGFYVASLRPEQLKAEGAALGICVGRGGYARRLRDGDIQIFSIRTESGESKFCIERDVETGRIVQIKGTANRLPGFEPYEARRALDAALFEAGIHGTDAAPVLTKPDDVRLVVEFLQAWGYSDEAIATMNDIGPGVRTMLENGINPFIPPPKRQRPVLSPEEREARRLAAMRRRAAENPGLRPSPATAAMIREDYAHPWGGRWGT